MFKQLSQLLLLLLLGGCYSFQYNPSERVVSMTKKPSEQSVLHKISHSLAQPQPQTQSGFYLIKDGLSAFTSRNILIDQAQDSLDLQYYIFKADVSGKMLIAKLLQAADRGVRVRVLVDDLGTPLQSKWLPILNRHPNIAIRSFNPVKARKGVVRALQQAGSFPQTNRRMHNKLLIADNSFMITGGRNIGDEYFSNTDRNFQDTDVLALGPVVTRSSGVFDDFWNHILAVPLDYLLEDEDNYSIERLRSIADSYLDQGKGSEFSQSLEKSEFYSELAQGDLNFHWGDWQLYYDPPEKADPDEELEKSDYSLDKISDLLNNAKQRLYISSAYFVPTEAALKLLKELAQSGADVQVLTNSLSTTDVALVHSGYADDRKPLLTSGIKLYELRSTAKQKERLYYFKGRSKASLHSKTFVVDKDISVIGSGNFDPRSIYLNTELGVVVKNTGMNQELADLFAELTQPNASWQLSLDDQEKLVWQAIDDNDQPLIYHTEPETSCWTRFKVWLMALLPLDSQI